MAMNSLIWEQYVDQKNIYWPEKGKHILAQYDDKTIVVYQAFNPQIAAYAVDNQKFGGKDYKFNRMSWIKTNFLWMMYRCGWASKDGQERVLAIRIGHEAFESILSQACTGAKEKAMNIKSQVRLQWDPDHSPSGSKLDRRAIQLGLKYDALEKFATKDIVSITDITDEVKHEYHLWNTRGIEYLKTPSERVYSVGDTIKKQIDMLDSE